MTKQIFDEDSANIVYHENRREQKETNEKKNEILNMVPGERKQKAWSQLFPQVAHSDDYLLGTIF